MGVAQRHARQLLRRRAVRRRRRTRSRTRERSSRRARRSSTSAASRRGRGALRSTADEELARVDARARGARRRAGLDRHVEGRGRATRARARRGARQRRDRPARRPRPWQTSSPRAAHSSVSCTCRASRGRCRPLLATTTWCPRCWLPRGACRVRGSSAGSPRSGSASIPGIGFGKTPDQNLELVRRLDEVCARSDGPCSSASRARARSGRFSAIRTRRRGRLAASLGAAVAAFERGAWMIRAHDVRETVEALAVAAAVERGKIDRMTIELRGLVVFGHHGYLEEERRLGQRFLVDLWVDVDGERDRDGRHRRHRRLPATRGARARGVRRAGAAPARGPRRRRGGRDRRALPVGRARSRPRAQAGRRARSARRVRGPRRRARARVGDPGVRRARREPRRPRGDAPPCRRAPRRRSTGSTSSPSRSCARRIPSASSTSRVPQRSRRGRDRRCRRASSSTSCSTVERRLGRVRDGSGGARAPSISTSSSTATRSSTSRASRAPPAPARASVRARAARGARSRARDPGSRATWPDAPQQR